MALYLRQGLAEAPSAIAPPVVSHRRNLRRPTRMSSDPPIQEELDYLRETGIDESLFAAVRAAAAGGVTGRRDALLATRFAASGWPCEEAQFHSTEVV